MITTLTVASCNRNEYTRLQQTDISYPRVELPDVTSELKICMNSSLGPYKDAINTFIAHHPEINVTLEEIIDQWGPPDKIDAVKAERAAQIQRIETELMSGYGADVFLLDASFSSMSGLFPDLNKTSMSGAFLDLSPYVNGGNLIDLEEYYKVVITAMTYMDKQYLLPLTFNIPLGVSTEANLKSIGFDMSKAQKDIYSFDDELFKKLPKDQYWAIFRGYEFSGNTEAVLIDYVNRTVHFDDETIRYVFEQFKATSGRLQDEDLFGKFNYFVSLPNSDSAKRILDGDPFLCMLGQAGVELTHAQAITYCGTEPVLFPIPNEYGGLSADIFDCVAIRSNSENAGTAMRLIQFLLSAEVQSAHGYMNHNSIPVRRDALNEAIEWRKTGYGEAYGLGLDSLSEKNVVGLRKTLDRISCSRIQNRLNPVSGVEGVDIQKEIDQYVKGEITYDEMAEICGPRLILYLNE